MDITEFLTARYDEAEAIAKAAASQASFVAVPGNDEGDPGPWCAAQGGEGVTTENAYAGAPFLIAPQGYSEPNVVEHIVRHDPAHALDDLTIKRYLLNEYKLAAVFDVDAAAESALNADNEEAQLLQLAEVAAKEAGKNVLLGVVKALASAYALHPDYDPAWSLWPHVRALAEKAKG